MYCITILYGHPHDPSAFERYYWEQHLLLAAKLRRVKGFSHGQIVALAPDLPAPYYRIVKIYANNLEEVQAILISPECQAITTDLQNFATGGAALFVNHEEVLVPVSLRRPERQSKEAGEKASRPALR